ncbi:MAG: hypothetical protein K2K63_18200 [Acetatifactor sp.]|nr:hypothetical protein [Acetatifactor sp.]
MEVLEFTREMIPYVMDFERRLRGEEPFYNWDIDEAYRKRVAATFDDPRFTNAISLLACESCKVVGRPGLSLCWQPMRMLSGSTMRWREPASTMKQSGLICES